MLSETNSRIGRQYPSVPLKNFRVEYYNSNTPIEQQQVGFQIIEATREEEARARFSSVYSNLQIINVKEVNNG